MNPTVKHIVPNVSYFRLEGHESLIKDKIRCEKYQAAINSVIKKGDIVLDFGTGSGILSFFANQAGASKIYAIEREQIISIAREVNKANKFDNIQFQEIDSKEFTFEKKFDVLLAEPIGNFGLNTFNIHDYFHLRDNFLKENGTIIPQSLSLHICPIYSLKLKNELNIWNEKLYNIDFSVFSQYARNQVYNISTDDCIFLSTPQQIFQLDFKKDKINNISTQNNFQITQFEELIGICGWFELNLTNDIIIKTGPFDVITSWYQTLFPTFNHIPLLPNDNLTIKISNEFNNPQIIWKWEIDLYRNGEKILTEFHNSNEGFPQKPYNLPVSYYIVF